MRSTDYFAKWVAAVPRMREQNEFGALHIFVSDGNCEDDHLEFCLAQENITPIEREFCYWMLTEFREEERAAVYLLKECEDIT